MTSTLKVVLRTLLLAGIYLLFTTGHAHAQRFWLTLTNPDDLYSEISVMFADDASDGVDHYEARKNRDGAPIVFYSKIDTIAYSLQALPLIADKSVTLGIDASVTGLYLLRLTNIQNIDESVTVVLEDLNSSTFTNLRVTPEYLFSLTAGSGIERFRLHFNPPVEMTATSGACDGTESNVQFAQPGNYEWSYLLKNENNAVLDAASSWNGVATFSALPTGTYTISLTDSYGYTVEKQASIVNVEPVVARFQVSDSVALVNNPVYFFDYSIGASDFIWNFGDGNIVSGSAFPTNVFTQAGTYNVQFTASNDDCNDYTSKTIYVEDGTTGIGQADAVKPIIYGYAGEVFIKIPGLSERASVEIYNMLGQRIRNEKIFAAGELRFPVPQKNSLLFVRVSIGDKLFEKEVFLH